MKLTDKIIDKAKGIFNAHQMPETFYCKHMVQGVAGYMDENIRVDMDAILSMMESFEGKPVFVDHQDVPVEEIQAKADGYVSDCFYNESDGWFWAKFVAVSDKAHEAIGRGWAVSNAYVPTKLAGGGTLLNMPYNREVLEGGFTHLAIVPNPRYEDACIMTKSEFKAYNLKRREQLNELKNSKDEPKEETEMIKFWKKTEVTDLADLSNASLTLENGKDVTIAEMVEKLEIANAEEAKEEEKENTAVDMSQLVNVAGKDMTIDDLVSTYNSMVEKENAKAEDEAKAEKEVADKKAEEEKTNAKELEDKEAEEMKHVDELKNAISEGQNAPVMEHVETTQDAIARGKERY